MLTVRKDTRLSPLFRTASDEKLGGAWERGYLEAETISRKAVGGKWLKVLSPLSTEPFKYSIKNDVQDWDRSLCS